VAQDHLPHILGWGAGPLIDVFAGMASVYVINKVLDHRQ